MTAYDNSRPRALLFVSLLLTYLTMAMAQVINPSNNTKAVTVPDGSPKMELRTSQIGMVVIFSVFPFTEEAGNGRSAQQLSVSQIVSSGLVSSLNGAELTNVHGRISTSPVK